MNNMAILQVLILERLTFQKAHHYAAYSTEYPLNLSVRLICWSSWPNVSIQERHTFEDHLNVISVSSILSKNNMADMRISEMVALQLPNLL